LIAEFDDPRLVAIYDAVNAYGDHEQPDFYAQVATDIGATAIVELGCGTGLVTCHLAERGYRITGVDRSSEMLAFARRRHGADQVTWVHGGAPAFGAPEADLAFMAGHVAQFFITDDEWCEALGALHHALRPGGVLAFETRNPDAREWERWSADRIRSVDDPDAGRIETWTECHDVRDGIVSYTNHYRFAATGETLTSSAALRFRALPALDETLAAAGFNVDDVYGNWDRTAVSPTAPELILVAHR
jgi:SAM-dependent methyltransferase